MDLYKHKDKSLNLRLTKFHKFIMACMQLPGHKGTIKLSGTAARHAKSNQALFHWPQYFSSSFDIEYALCHKDSSQSRITFAFHLLEVCRGVQSSRALRLQFTQLSTYFIFLSIWNNSNKVDNLRRSVNFLPSEQWTVYRSAKHFYHTAASFARFPAYTMTMAILILIS